jgi:hypothetical protein
MGINDSDDDTEGELKEIKYAWQISSRGQENTTKLVSMQQGDDAIVVGLLATRQRLFQL